LFSLPTMVPWAPEPWAPGRSPIPSLPLQGSTPQIGPLLRFLGLTHGFPYPDPKSPGELILGPIHEFNMIGMQSS